MTSLTTRATNQVLRLAVKSFRGSQSGFVRRFRLLTRVSASRARLPKGVMATSDQVGGVPGDWLVPRQSRGTLLYLHGGAFVAGSPAMYRSFCAALARRLSLRVFVPDYRLAPEHAFPAALDDAAAVYEALLTQLDAGEALVVAGDSAGGNLALGVIQHAVTRGLRLPSCGLLISPGLDMMAGGPSLIRNERRDHMLSRHIIDHAIAAYLQGGDASDPRATPLRGIMAGLPPLLVTASESECLHDDATRLCEAITRVGGSAQLLTRPDMPHVWPVFSDLLPEAAEDFQYIAAWVDALLDAPPGSMSFPLADYAFR